VEKVVERERVGSGRGGVKFNVANFLSLATIFYRLLSEFNIHLFTIRAGKLGTRFISERAKLSPISI